MSEQEQGPYQAEAAERWGSTEAYKTSAKRTKQYGDVEWKAIKAEAESIEAAFADAMRAGQAPTSAAAVALAERARQHIDRWFYPCSREMHASLGQMYTSDDRFRAHYDDRAEGLAEYVAAAIAANGTAPAG